MIETGAWGMLDPKVADIQGRLLGLSDTEFPTLKQASQIVGGRNEQTKAARLSEEAGRHDRRGDRR
jgi:hypothetical protein